MATNLSGKKILVTGPTGQVGLPVTLASRRSNDVSGIARFSDAAARERARGGGRDAASRSISRPTDFSRAADGLRLRAQLRPSRAAATPTGTATSRPTASRSAC